MVSQRLLPLRALPALLRVAVALVGGTSVGSLLLYFWGVLAMPQAVLVLLVPGMGLIGIMALAARRQRDADLWNRIVAGVWAGAIATLAYDLVRIPIVVAGVPVFKAISYFGTTMIGVAHPTALTELLGWAYHLSNGIGFGLAYAVVVRRPSWWTAVIWGLMLEGTMLLTPYAEVFGYRVGVPFLTITLGAHVVYGVTLWAALTGWQRRLTSPARTRGSVVLAGWLLVPIGVGATAFHFHTRFAAALEPSPPPYIGRNLYVTWNVPEPDRVAAIWVFRRFVNPSARFYYVEPFAPLRFGTPFDVPEADVRRRGSQSATEVLLRGRGLDEDPQLARLGRMAHLFEVSPWMKPAQREDAAWGRALAEASQCDRAMPPERCFRAGLAWLDAWYEASDDR